MKQEKPRTLQVSTYIVVARAVDEGARYGVSRYNKYAEVPLTDTTVESLCDHIERGVLNALCEVIDFEQS